MISPIAIMPDFIEARAIHRLIGNQYPFGAMSLMDTLESYLRTIAARGDNFPQQLLRHNLSGRRDRGTSEFFPADVDVLMKVDVAKAKTDLCLKDYRVHSEFARPREEQRPVLHIQLFYPGGIQWVIHLPLQALMKGFGDTEEGFQCYAHGIARLKPNTGQFQDESFYCGITSRNWLRRMSEHFAEVRSGSNKLFHKVWREFQGQADVLLNSELIALNHSHEAAMAWEEMVVDRYMENKQSLNMIPGGFKGLQFLHKLGYLAKINNVNEDEQDRAVREFAKAHPRAGVPNLLIAGLWEDDRYYARVIQARQNTLSPDQVKKIRYLAALDWSAERIVTEVGAINVQQVRNVIKGRTYSRMH